MSVPATAVQHQHENQATAVLAWLADRSLPFARRLAQLFLGSREPAASSRLIGARAQLSLSRPDGRGTVFPDLSLDGTDRTFQVLVEVKVGSEFGVHLDDGGQSVIQPEHYRRLWAALPANTEARVRAVATLTRDGSDSAADLHGLRGRDASWSELRSLLDELLDTGSLASDVEVVAASFRDAIVAQIAPEPVDLGALPAWLAAHRPVIELIAGQVSRAFGSTALIGGSGRTYTGARLALKDKAGRPLIVRVYATPAGGGLNAGGWGDAIIAVLERDADGNLDPGSAEAARGAGFQRLKDIDSFWMHRAIWPLDEWEPASIAADLIERLRRTHLLSD